MQIISSQYNKNPYYFVSKKQEDEKGQPELEEIKESRNGGKM